jgi:hypothetical protein
MGSPAFLRPFNAWMSSGIDLFGNPSKKTVLHFAEQTHRLIEVAGRWTLTLPTRGTLLLPSNQKILKRFLNSPKENYWQDYANITQSILSRKNIDFEINTESGRLRKFSNVKTPTLFLINHDHIQKDGLSLVALQNLISRTNLQNGLKAGKLFTVVNDDIINTQPYKLHALAKKCGVIGVDASIFNPDKHFNQKMLMPAIRGLFKDEGHLFMFPEGKMAAFKSLSREKRIQSGFVNIIEMMIKHGKTLRVVPVGLAYNKRAASIYLGRPVFFRQINKHIQATPGDLNSKDIFNCTPNGKKTAYSFLAVAQPADVNTRKRHPAIHAHVCENLDIARNYARQQLFDSVTVKR